MYKNVILVLLLWAGLYGCKGLEAVDEETETKVIELSSAGQSVILSSDEQKLFVSVGKSGMDIFDVADTRHPRLLKNYETGDFTYSLTRSGERLFMANGSAGVEILDISVPDVPRQIAFIDTGDDNATSVAVSANAVMLAVGTAEGVQLHDIQQETFPRYLGRYESNGTMMTLHFGIDSGHLYAGNGSYGFELLDISVPARMELLGGVALEGSARDIAVDTLKRNIYTATLTSALKKIDLVDIREPAYSVVYDAHDDGEIWDIETSTGGRIYLARGRKGLEILSADANGALKHFSSYDTNGTARGVAVNRAETIAYVADGREGLKVIDISDKLHPVRIGYSPF